MQNQKKDWLQYQIDALKKKLSTNGTIDHAKLENLDYENSGHKGFASSSELNDYAKKDVVPTNKITNLDIDNLLET